MYNGYRLKINNTEVKNSLISKGTFNLEEQDRIIRQWQDATHTDHYDVAKKKRMVCTFSFREHLSEEHSTFANLLANRENVVVEYFSDNDDSYKISNCRIEAPAFHHEDIIGNQILYGTTEVTITEY